MTSILRLPRALWRDRDGASVIELALALPFLMLLLVGMIDISHLVSNRIDVEQAAQRVTDYALAVRPPNANTTYLKTEASRVTDPNTDKVAVNIFLECDGVRQSSFNTICATGQDSARFVSVNIDRQVDFLFNWSSLTKLFGSQVMGSGITVRGDSIVRFQ